MNLEEFINECNKSPIFRKKNVSISKEILKEYDFVKKRYELNDLVILSELLTTPQLKFIEPVEIEKMPKKYLWHQEIVKHADRQKDIIENRKELKISSVLSGFIIDKKPNISIILGATNPKKYELSSSRLLLRSSKFENWINEFYSIWGMKEANKKIQEIIYKILNKWELPERYYDAIEELLFFNRIVPANKGAKIIYKQHPFVENKYEKFIKIESGLSATELAKILKQEDKITKAEDKNLLLGKKRAKKRSKIREKILKLYAKYKTETNIKNTALKIKRELWNEEISIDAIKKIIKRG